MCAMGFRFHLFVSDNSNMRPVNINRNNVLLLNVAQTHGFPVEKPN